MSKKCYPFIDIMRIIASLLVIAIHTDPLTSFNPQLNFLITRVFGRLAVPFFFMTTAYFLFNQGMPTYAKLKSVIKQFLIIDICSILLYLTNLKKNCIKGFNKRNLMKITIITITC